MERAEIEEPLPPDLIGAKIKAFGAPIGLDGVGLVAEYVPEGSIHWKVLAFAFDASRIWARSNSQLLVSNADESPK
jgi:hypothetical protein